MQYAYGVLDKFKISRTFFVKTDQNNCETTADAEEAEDIPDSGYDIVVDDDTVSTDLFNNHGYDNPQINQVQHIAHVQNLQQFSPYVPGQPHIPQIHHVHGVAYYKQNDKPAEKSALNLTETKADETKKIDIKEIEKKTEEKKETEATTKLEELKEKIQATTLPIPLAINATTAKEQSVKNEEKPQN